MRVLVPQTKTIRSPMEKLLMNKITRNALFCLYASPLLAFAGAPKPSPDGSTQIAEGVFQRTEADGTIVRAAYGAAGAAYDRQVINANIAEIDSLARTRELSKGEADQLAANREALAGLPTGMSSSPRPDTVSKGTLCNRFYYGLDEHFVVGNIGATSVTRAAISSDGFGPPPNFISSLAYASASVKPYGGSTTTVFHSAQSTPLDSIADLNFGVVIPSYPSSNTCTGSGYSYVTLKSSECTGGTGFVSLTKSYTTCASVP